MYTLADMIQTLAPDMIAGEADKIPIGPEYGTHLVDYTPPDGPLR